MVTPTPVYLEVGSKKVFASALDWPGWCRAGKDEEAALEALASYVPRYASVAEEAGVRFPKSAGDSFDVVERVKGGATTDFGAPGEPCAADQSEMTAAVRERHTSLVRASWTVFDQVAAGAPASLRKGPRGGGRDRDKMIGHVLGAEAVYARKIGVRHKEPALGDPAAIESMRADIVEALLHPQPVAERGWLPRYAARRIAWHVLDHAWEMEDRTEPEAENGINTV